MNTTLSLQVCITLICWMLFSAIWLWQRNKAKENVNTRTVSQKFSAFLGYAIIFTALYLPLLFAKGEVSRSVIPPYSILQNLGALLCVIGVFTAIWSRLLLGWNWSGGVSAKKGHELIVTGPYRLVRHPIYTGFIAALIGTCLVMGGIVGIVVSGLYILGLYAKINKEEQLLTELFGDTYSKYQKRTCKLIPFLW